MNTERSEIINSILDFKNTCEKIREERLSNEKTVELCIDIFVNKINPFINVEAFEYLLSIWGTDKVISVLRKKYWEDYLLIAEKLRKYEFPLVRDEIHTVGIFYHRLCNGGLERVISLVLPLMVERGFKVILLTDEEPSKDDYIIPQNVEREVLFDGRNTNANNYSTRCDEWQRYISKHDIDVILYEAWNEEIMLWDMLCIKQQGIFFTMHTHLTFSSLIDISLSRYKLICNLASMSDGVVAITKADYYFWNNITEVAAFIPNPIADSLKNKPCKNTFNHNIVWLARMEVYKRPVDAIKIVERVVRVIPDVKLYMVGEPEEKKDFDIYKGYVKEKGLENNVIFVGFTKDVEKFYEQASLHLLTSEIEGFSMVLLESKAYGIPTVMYDLNYLDMVRDGDGVFVAPIGDIDTLANYVIELFSDSDKYKDAIASTKNSFERYCEFDTAAAWKSFFDKVAKFKNKKLTYNDGRVVFELINSKVLDSSREEVVIRRMLDAEKVCGEVIESSSFKIGRFITWAPRTIRDLFTRKNKSEDVNE